MMISQYFPQETPLPAWTINHNFTSAPICDVMVEQNGQIVKILPLSIKYISSTQILVEFTTPTAGSARLVGQFISVPAAGPGSVDLGQYYVPPALAEITFDGTKKSEFMVLSNGDLTVTANTADYQNVLADRAITTGKYYWEVTVNQLGDPTDMYVGLCAIPTNGIYNVFFARPEFGPYGALRSNGGKFTTGSGSGSPQVYSTPGTVVGIAVDLAADKMWFSINGSWSFGEDPATGTASSVTNAGFGEGPLYPFIGTDNNSGIVQATATFSESEYQYPMPTGFSDFSGV